MVFFETEKNGILLSSETENIIIRDRKAYRNSLQINPLRRDNFLNVLFKTLKNNTPLKKTNSSFLMVFSLA
jgi:hypothetical protein